MMNNTEKNFTEMFCQIHNYARFYQHYDMRNRRAEEIPHQGQGRLLALLKLKPETTQKDLAYLLGMRQQSVSELLKKLEEKAYITRKPFEEDKRITIISLTPAGEKAAENISDKKHGDFEALFSSFTPQEQEELTGYLGRITKGLENLLEEKDPNWQEHFPFRGGFPQGGRGCSGKAKNHPVSQRTFPFPGHRGPQGPHNHGYPHHENSPIDHRGHFPHGGSPMGQGPRGNFSIEEGFYDSTENFSNQKPFNDNRPCPSKNPRRRKINRQKNPGYYSSHVDEKKDEEN